MKTIIRVIVVIAALMAVAVHAESRASAPRKPHDSGVDATSRFIFYSVLEGLYEDGLSNADVDQILIKKEHQGYFNFIYACPVCTATLWAAQAYRSRPEGFYGWKVSGATFGPGLSGTLHDQLYSENPRARLGAINTLVKTWIGRRITSMNLSKKEHAELLKALEKKREEGMAMLEGFRRQSKPGADQVAIEAPAYVDLEECAVCNGAVGKPMKLPDAKPK